MESGPPLRRGVILGCVSPGLSRPSVSRVYRGLRTGYRLVVYIKVYKFQAGLAGIFPRWAAVGRGR